MGSRVGFLYGKRDPQARKRDDAGGEPNGGENLVAPLCDHAEHQATNGITRISPVSIGAQDASTLQWGRHIGHGGDQVGIEKGHAQAHYRRRGNPRGEAADQRSACKPRSQQGEACQDGRSATDAIGEMSGPKLTEPPDHRIDTGDPADLHDAQAVKPEKDREEDPNQGIGNLVGDPPPWQRAR